MDDFFAKREKRRKRVVLLLNVGFIAVFLLIMYGCYVANQEEQARDDYCRNTRVTDVGYEACMNKAGYEIRK